MKILIAFFISFGAGAVEFRQSEKSDNLSQFVRSNTRHYWHYMRAEADLSAIKSYLPFEGVVAGDPHLGNFAPLPLAGPGGRRTMKFVDVDFDDAGRAPFVLDFVRYVVAVEATFPQTKKRDLEEAYLQGLRGHKSQAPDSLDEFMKVTVEEYDRLVAETLAKHTDEHGFIRKAGKIEEYRGSVSRAEIEKVFVGQKVIDVARRPKDRGGSADGIRIWVLIEDKGVRRIMELKEFEAPGVSFYEPQASKEKWLADIRAVFWPGLDGSSYDLVEAGGLTFWLRPKGAGLVDVPYSSEKRKKMEFATDLAIYDANILGLAHGRQDGAAGYRALIERDRESFHENLETVVQDYLKIAKRAFNR